MIHELHTWLDRQGIGYIPIDKEVVEIPGFGKLFMADLSQVESIFRIDGDNLRFNLSENAEVLMDEGIYHVAFPFGRNWYYYDLREEFKFNILKYIGRSKMVTDTAAISPSTNIPFVNLGVHTPYELLNAAGSIETLCRKAKWLGHSAIGICDRNTMAATLVLQKECTKVGLKHIFGYSTKFKYQDQAIDVKIYALNNDGLHNLLRIQRAVMVDADDEAIDYTSLLKCASGCALVFGVYSAQWLIKHPNELEQCRQYFEMIFYQVDANEYKADRIDREKLEALNCFFDNCYDAAKDTFIIEPILIADSYYPDRDDARAKILLNKIATGAAHEQSDEQYFKSAQEHYDTLRPIFSDKWDFDSLFKRMCRHTVEIAEQASAAFETGRMYMPEYMMREEEKSRYGDRRTMFLQLLEDGLCSKVPSQHHPKYRERLDEEVYIIESTNNVDYFLVQWDMVCEARRRGIAVGIGRGSAGGSLVSYLLGITSIDPIRYDLLFSRFLVPERCGLTWKDEITTLAEDHTIDSGQQYVEIDSDDKCYRFATDAELRVIRQEEEKTIYADELRQGDKILFDHRDILWNGMR